MKKFFLIFFATLFIFGCEETKSTSKASSGDAAALPEDVTPVDAADDVTPVDAEAKP